MPYVIQTFDKPDHGHVRVANRAVATSGDYERFFTWRGCATTT